MPEIGLQTREDGTAALTVIFSPADLSAAGLSPASEPVEASSATPPSPGGGGSPSPRKRSSGSRSKPRAKSTKR